MSNQMRWLMGTGALMGALGVGLGAFGAHALQSYLGARAGDGDQAARLLNTWEIAVRYQMYHALALLLAAALVQRVGGYALTVTGISFTAGVLIFSGCLYALVLTGARWLGAVVPVGGVLMIVGWIALLWAGLTSRS